jgi:hypothetical protein
MKSRINKKQKSRMKRSLKRKKQKFRMKRSLKRKKQKGGFISSPASYPEGYPWDIGTNLNGNYYLYNNKPVVPLNFMVSSRNTL